MAPREPGSVARQLVAEMPSLTIDRIGELALGNARRNLEFRDRGQSIAALRNQRFGKADAALVVAAGPSIARRDPARLLRHIGFDGSIICTDSAIYYLLRNGIVPDLVVTLDPHATRIVRWFGDPKLSEAALESDDYFRRQDMDANFIRELEINRELLALLDRHGRDMRIALSTSASAAVVDRVLSTGMQVFWWNPMFDDPADRGGVTAGLQAMNGLPAVNAGGNVGAACWMMADAVLGLSEVAVTGMDFSYYSDTPYSRTQYYSEAVDLVGEDNLDSVFIRINNPYLDIWFYTDPAYMWYRTVFLEMVQQAQCRTVNCTEGGILFGDGIEFIPLQQYLDRSRPARAQDRLAVGKGDTHG